MMVLPGRTALSVARKANALARVRAVDPEVTSLEARWVHLVVSDSELSVDEVVQLSDLLRFGRADAPAGARGRVEGVEPGCFV
jgi:phosphoribosylformylglycinamidine synthase